MPWIKLNQRSQGQDLMRQKFLLREQTIPNQTYRFDPLCVYIFKIILLPPGAHFYLALSIFLQDQVTYCNQWTFYGCGLIPYTSIVAHYSCIRTTYNTELLYTVCRRGHTASGAQIYFVLFINVSMLLTQRTEIIIRNFQHHFPYQKQNTSTAKQVQSPYLPTEAE